MLSAIPPLITLQLTAPGLQWDAADTKVTLTGTALDGAPFRLEMLYYLVTAAQTTAWVAWAPVHKGLMTILRLENGKELPATMLDRSMLWHRLIADHFRVHIIKTQTKKRHELVADATSSAERELLKKLHPTTGLCPIAAFMRLFLSGVVGYELRDLFLNWLLTLPESVTDAILDPNERSQIQFLRDGAALSHAAPDIDMGLLCVAYNDCIPLDNIDGVSRASHYRALRAALAHRRHPAVQKGAR